MSEDTSEAQDALPVGTPPVAYIWAIVTSERQRMSRHERWAGEQFSSLRGDFNEVRQSVRELDGKLDEIRELLATQAGSKLTFNALTNRVFWLGGISVTIALWALDHIHSWVAR